MEFSSRAAFASRSWASSTPAHTADMTPIIINNCEYFLGRQADVQVITEYDDQSETFKALAVRFRGTSRIAVAAGSGKVAVEALDALHMETARMTKRFNEATGILQTGPSNSPPSVQQLPCHDRDIETELDIDSESNLVDIDDVISLPSDDEDDPVEPKTRANWQALSTSSHSEEDSPEEYATELRDQLKQRNGNPCTTPPPVPERLMAQKSSLQAVSLRTHAFPGLPPAAAAPIDADGSFEAPIPSQAEPRLRRPACLTPPRSLDGSAPQHSPSQRTTIAQHRTCHGKGDELRHGNALIRLEVRETILNVSWAGRQGILRQPYNHHIHASALKITACRMAIHGKDQFVGQSRPVALDKPADSYTRSSDGHTILIATIKAIRQGGKHIPKPESGCDLSGILAEHGTPEFDIEVMQVLPPPPPGQMKSKLRDDDQHHATFSDNWRSARNHAESAPCNRQVWHTHARE
ncbi:hypothetical protein NLU13_6085 [Sarocladium strictum]|uniref:Uncharacterized protein n=1 Tax=Sarocladium strictum TaxID=5046 RepID=A0AA39GGI6_SARSR|nr:hypothetical protein NLU13_6085 [Sarocladium strictum]